jgi:hypothetical protein
MGKRKRAIWRTGLLAITTLLLAGACLGQRRITETQKAKVQQLELPQKRANTRPSITRTAT